MRSPTLSLVLFSYLSSEEAVGLRRLRDTFIGVVRQERGASMVEYALLVVLIAIVAYVAVELAGTQVSTTYTDIANSLVDASNG